uniref:Uncharacterized protein n=1 Tax=Arundo donax TaxID=35708 RepID=A0A0A9B0E5_ARUDO
MRYCAQGQHGSPDVVELHRSTHPKPPLHRS